MTYTSLHEKTIELLKYAHQSMNRYESVRNNLEIEYDFYSDIKPFCDRVYHLAKEWEELSQDWIQKEQPRYTNMNGIIQTIDNLNNVAVSSFDRKTSYKRFIDHYQSVTFHLNKVANSTRM
ncbi:DUF1798 family protein [Peribacillus alkalitolerans]|uniref:DUF1798 family protein n=1 Tax=Peribacillus alkalitolerans TaxID=1550385 RepID=UPI0013D141AB|nr:DUF1798 family protein [Peribacillus alkalitolerans]